MKNIMKKLLLAVFSITTTFSLYAQREVSQERMEQIYEEVKTPYKYGLAVAPTDNYHKIDCPTVFRQGDKWLMTYVVYNGKTGTDGRDSAFRKERTKKKVSEAFIFAGSDLCAGVGGADGHAAGIRA